MNNFKKDGFRKGGSAFGGKPRFGGGNKFGGGDRGHDRGNRPQGDRELFKTTCSACRKTCEVPFWPTGEKPVYCRECFGDKGSSDSHFSNRSDSRGGDFRRDARPQRDERPMRHSEVRAPRDTSSEDIKRQLSNLEAKIETILGLLKAQAPAKAEPKTTAAVKVETPVEEAPKKVRKPKTIKAKAPAKKKVAKKKTK